jgi:hypothetical protein
MRQVSGTFTKNIKCFMRIRAVSIFTVLNAYVSSDHHRGIAWHERIGF